MATFRASMLTLALLGLALCAGGGCSTWNLRKIVLNANDVHPQLEERQSAAVEQYEQRRTQAELQAVRNNIAQGNIADATAMLAAVIKRHPDHREAQLIMAELYLADDDAAAAERTLRGLLADDPRDGEAHHALALLLDTSGRSQEALKHFAAAGRKEANATTGPMEEAPPRPLADEHQRVLQSAQSAHAKKFLQHAINAIDAGDTAAAHDAAKAAMEAERKNHQIPLALAVYFLKLGRADDAVMMLTPVKNRFSDRADIHCALGAAHLSAGDLDEAQVVLLAAVSLDSAHPLSYFLLGQVLQERGQAGRAAEMVRQAHRLDPRYPQQL